MNYDIPQSPSPVSTATIIRAVLLLGAAALGSFGGHLGYDRLMKFRAQELIAARAEGFQNALRGIADEALKTGRVELRDGANALRLQVVPSGK